MNMEHVASLLNEISTLLNQTPSWTDGNGTRPHEYLLIESVAIDGALTMAEEFPGFEWDIWNTVAKSIGEMNATLLFNGAPQLRFVDYASFLEIVKAEAHTSNS